MVTIQLHSTPDSPYTDAESNTLHRISGRGVHNPEFNHQVKVYKHEGIILSAQPIIISAHDTGDRRERGEDLTIGDAVTLIMPGETHGKLYVLTARYCNDPELVRAVRI